MGDLGAISALYERGKYLRAYRAGLRSGLFARVESPEPHLLAARVVRQLGGERRARLSVLRTWRAHRASSAARYWLARELDNPVRALLAMDRFGDPSGADDGELLQSWYLLRASSLASLRDFAAAEMWWRRAQTCGDSAWLWCTRAIIDTHKDDLAAAEEAIARSLAVQPWYTPSVRVWLTILRRAQRGDEALALVRGAAAHVESYAIAMHEHFLVWEQGDYSGALRSLEQIVDLAPLMERDLHDWLLLRLARVSYLAGDRHRPARLAARIANEALHKLAARIGSAPEPRRTVLPVPLVPQNHNTCGPASLTSIGRFWKVEVAHEQLVEQICRDGTSAYSERRWAEGQGWVAREFTMTWAATCQLIDHGLPFAFVTTYEDSAHLQVAAGYDDTLGTVVVRDPSSLSLAEYDWDELESKQAAFGPRAMVMVPEAERQRLAAIELPDSDLYDALYAVEAALDRHDRAAAAAARDHLEQRAAEHFLTLRANRAIAAYDADPLGLVAWADAMLAKHPNDVRMQVAKLRAMAGLAAIAERLEFAERFAAENRSPLLWAELATLVATTPGGHGRAGALLWRALDGGYAAPAAHRALADHLWDGDDRRLAAALYRYASCLAEADESLAWSYFLACRLLGDTETALSHLRGRVERLGGRMPGPAITLADAYDIEHRHREALDVLTASEADHAEDGGFLLSIAEHHLNEGALDRARELVARAEGRVRKTAWLRTAARVALVAGDRETAAAHWRQVAEAEPLAMDAQRATSHFTAMAHGTQAAVDYLRGIERRFPNHVALARLIYERLCDIDDGQAQQHLASYLQRHPEDCEAHRDMAVLRARDGDISGATEQLARARSRGDDSAAFYVAQGRIWEAAGDAGRARAAFFTALQRSVDATYAINALMSLSSAADARAQVLEEVFSHLLGQPSQGDAVSTYFEHASEWLEPSELAARLDRLVATWPRMFEVQLARVTHHGRMGALDAARRFADQMVEQFALLPGAWRCLAMVHGHAGDVEAQVDALQRALALNPRWGTALRELSAAYSNRGQAAAAQEVLERAIAQEPLDPINRGYLAEVLWCQGDRAGALAQLKKALELSPGYRWGWEMLGRWADDPHDAVEFARALARTRGGVSTVWIAAAELMPHAPLADRLECLDEAIRCAPRDLEPHDLKAVLLCAAGRYDDALAACRPPLWGDAPPIPLRGRAAWVRYEQGEFGKARAELLDVIRDAPDYAWGIETLLEWARGEGADEYVQTCRRLVQVAPRSATAHAQLGEALRGCGDREAAQAAFARALELAPADHSATLGLADLYLDQGRPDDAATTLDSLGDHHAAVIQRRAAISIERGDVDGLRTALEALLRRPELDAGVIDRTLARIRAQPLRKAAHQLLNSWMDRADAAAHVGIVWLARIGRRLPAPLLWRRLAGFPARSKARTMALMTYIEDLGDRKRRYTFAIFGLIYRRLLQSSAGTWGSVSYALICLERFRSAARWLADYRERDGVEGWMIWNLALALRIIGKHQLAADAHRHALSLPDERHSYQHRLWLAVHEAAHGDAATAARLLAEAEGPPWKLADEFVAGATRALLQWREDKGGEGARYRSLSDALRAAKDRLGGFGQHPECGSLYRWLTRLIAARRGGWAGLQWWLRSRW
jgi:cellulose synthase operon protein C